MRKQRKDRREAAASIATAASAWRRAAHHVIAFLMACASVFASGEVLADETAAPSAPALGRAAGEDPEVIRLGAYLHSAASQSRSARRALLVTGVVAGAALIPVGRTLWLRADPVSQSIGAGMTIGGAAPLAFSLLGLFPSHVEKVEADYQRRRAAAVPRAELVDAARDEWSEGARASRTRRIWTGIIGIGLGGAATGAGLALLVADPFGGFDRNQQYTVGSILTGAGVPILSVGIRALMQESPEEIGWSNYELAGGDLHAARRVESSADVVLLPGGALARVIISL